jgi:flagellar hook protein FlgE
MSLIGTLDTAQSALASFQQGLEVIGNNIANVDTQGFKASSVSYSDAFYNVLKGAAPAPASGNGSATPAREIGGGVGLSGISQDFTQGSISSTGVATNLAISGNGFFIVKDPASGSQYATRNGQFTTDASGYLITSQGYRVQGLTGGTSGSAPTTVGSIKLGTPPTGTSLQSISFDANGNLTESYSDGTTATTNAVLLQNYSDPQALQSIGHNLYTNLTAAAPVGSSSLSAANNAAGTQGLGSIQSGALEGSNVDLTAQFASMITTQRSFEAASRLITVSDTILSDVTDLKRS